MLLLLLLRRQPAAPCGVRSWSGAAATCAGPLGRRPVSPGRTVQYCTRRAPVTANSSPTHPLEQLDDRIRRLRTDPKPVPNPRNVPLDPLLLLRRRRARSGRRVVVRGPACRGRKPRRSPGDARDRVVFTELFEWASVSPLARVDGNLRGRSGCTARRRGAECPAWASDFAQQIGGRRRGSRSTRARSQRAAVERANGAVHARCDSMAYSAGRAVRV